MKNVQLEIKGTLLIITVDMSKEFGRSASGKTTIIASTEGNQAVAGPKGEPLMVGLNVYKK